MSANFTRFYAVHFLLSGIVMIAVAAMQVAAIAAPDEPTQTNGRFLFRRGGRSDKPSESAGAEELAKETREARADAARLQAKKAVKNDDSEKPARDLADQEKANKNKSATSDSKKKDSQDANVAKQDYQLGEPLAPGMMQLLHDEIVSGLQKRGITDRFAKFQSYATAQVVHSAAPYTGSELAGNCRIKWYEQMMRNMLAAPAEAERFTRHLHAAVRDENEGLAKVLDIAAVKMDLGGRKARRLATPPKSAEEALEILEQALADAQVAYNKSLAPLSKQEIQMLQANLVPVLTTQNQVGHTVNDRGMARMLCDTMEKMDRGSLYDAAGALAPLTDVRFLEQLKKLPTQGNVKVPGVTGMVVGKIETQSGTIIIGGKGPKTYHLDQMPNVVAVIDLGGGNTYYEGAVGLERPVLVVIDLGGNNTFRGVQPGIQGGAVLGVSMLLTLGDNNVYDAQDIAQGSALAGVGIQIDYGSHNRYRGIRRVQGQALGGVGILIARGGHNDYHAAMWAQGMGGPLGFGLLDDIGGNDHYYCGGMWRNSYYPETPGYEGWGQGVGAGLRAVACGGIGVILDGGGENTYEFDYLAHGGGYWCGLGFARDFGGNTKRLISRTAYNGGPRAYESFQRFGCGWGCHYAMGFLFDDSGDDVYEGTIMGTGMAWDCSMGVLCDFAGNDQYKATGGIVQGSGAQMGIGILFDYKGDDVYEGYGQGYASPSISYHHLPDCGGNFGFLIDYGGKDEYGCGAENNSYIQRGDVGGFLIDRPQRDEVEQTTAAAKSQNTRGS